MNGLVIDCGSCLVRSRGCGDCVVSALLGEPGEGPTVLGDDERRALRVFSEAGLLPPLRLVRPVASGDPGLWAASG